MVFGRCARVVRAYTRPCPWMAGLPIDVERGDDQARRYVERMAVGSSVVGRTRRSNACSGSFGARSQAPMVACDDGPYDDAPYDDTQDHDLCHDCKGSGWYVGFTDRRRCPTCDGSGYL